MRKPKEKEKVTTHLHAFGDSLNVDSSTPQSIYELFFDPDGEFRCQFDPCPLGGLKMVEEGKIGDGLTIPWEERNFVNPPWTPRLTKKLWIKKAISEFKNGKYVALLIPARVSAKYWTKYFVPHACRVMILEHHKKLRFGGYKGACPFPVAVVILDPENDSRPMKLQKLVKPFKVINFE